MEDSKVDIDNDAKPELLNKEDYISLFISAFQNSPNAICITTVNNNIIAMNKAGLKMFGYTDNEIIGEQVTILQSKNNPPGLNEEIINSALKDGWEGELLNVRKNGEEFPVHLAKSTVKNDRGQLIAFIGISRDISSERKMEAELRGAKEESDNLLSALNKAYRNLKNTQDELIRRERVLASGELSAQIAHEIRNPLSIIGMSVQYLESKFEPNDPRREFTDAIIKKVERLDNITKELITFGRPLKFRMKRHNLKRLLNRILSLIKPRCKAQKITVVKDYCDNLSDVLIDDGHIEEVFTNIIANALDVMLKGGELTVRTEFDEAQKEAVVRISNTGHGIPKKDLPNLFKPFFTTKKQGTGLGLAISHRIVTEHKGTISVESNVRGRNKGTTFIIRLPV